MEKENRSKKVGSLKLEPLKGQFFDFKPASSGRNAPVFSSVKDYTRFALIAFFAFLILTLGNTYFRGKDVIFESSTLAYAGYGELQQGMDHLLKQDGPEAAAAFADAQQTFSALQKTTQPFTSQANNLTGKSDYLETADTLVKIALEVSEMGQELSSLAISLKDLPGSFLAEKDESPIQLIHEKKADLTKILELATSLQQKLTSLKVEVLPLKLQEKVRQAQVQVGQFLGLLMELNKATDQLLTLMGDRVPHRYLILLQNNHELRGTGGFIGSYMIVDVNDGKITKMESKDVYASDGQLSKFLPPPPGIDRVAKQWFMRDANYSPDFPTSAQQIMWFLEASRGPSVDTVVAVDQSLVEGILKIVGELNLEGLSTPVTAENFNNIVSFYTEAKLSGTNTPKQLLFDLIPRFKEKLSNFDNLGAILSLVKKMRQEGHVQFYSRDESVQALFENYGLSGEVVHAQPKMDYLNVISTSIGGNKTDEFIQTKLNHITEIDESGELTDELTIHKKDNFGEADRAKFQVLVKEYGTGKSTEGDLRNILGEGKNLDYMRVYVPLGSKIEEVKGVRKEDIETFQDLEYTVFGFVYGPVSPGEEKEVTLTYSLPFDLNVWPIDNYRFVAQKQAGVENITLHKTLKMPQALKVQKAFPEPPKGLTVPILEGEFDGTKLFMAGVARD